MELFLLVFLVKTETSVKVGSVSMWEKESEKANVFWQLFWAQVVWRLSGVLGLIKVRRLSPVRVCVCVCVYVFVVAYS